MTLPSVPLSHAAELHDLHETFVARVLPRVEAHGRVCFRHIQCPHHREELVAEMTAIVWRCFVRLVHRGKDVLRFVSALARYAARQVGSGRRICGRERAQDAMSGTAQRRRGFAVCAFSETGLSPADPLAEALHDNTVSPVLEQVVFRLDFPAWRRTRSQRDRQVIDSMMAGESTGNLSRLFGVSAARVAQLRREFHADWHAYCDMPVGQTV